MKDQNKPLLTDDIIFKASGFDPNMNEVDSQNCEAFDAGAKYARSIYEKELQRLREEITELQELRESERLYRKNKSEF